MSPTRNETSSSTCCARISFLQVVPAANRPRAARDVSARGHGSGGRRDDPVALYVQGRGHLRQDLHRQLSTKATQRKPRGPHGTARNNSPYREAFTISQRPPEVAHRAVPGHWEGDLVIGTGGTSAVGTLAGAAPGSRSCCTCPAATTPRAWLRR
jgi:hypothetical protein